MPFTTTTCSASEQAAWTANKPILVGTNALERFNAQPVWSSSGLWSDSAVQGAGSNITDTNWPTNVVFGRRGYLFTRPTAAAQTLNTIYLLFDLIAGTDDNQTIDLALAKLLNGSGLAGTCTMDLTIANDGDFTTPVAGGTLLMRANWQPSSDVAGYRGNRKRLNTNLPYLAPAFTRYQNVRWARLRINTDAVGGFGSVLPQVAAVMLSRRRQLGHQPRIPWDPEPSQGSVNDFMADSGALSRYVNFYGRQIFPMKFRPQVGQVLGVDDAATMRAFFNDTNSGTLPWMLIDAPHPPGGDVPWIGPAHWAYFPRPELLMPFIGPYAQEVELSAVELPIFEYLEQN